MKNAIMRATFWLLCLLVYLVLSIQVYNTAMGVGI